MLGKIVLAVVAFIDLYTLPYRVIPPEKYRGDTAAIVQFVNTREQMNLICEKLSGQTSGWYYIGCALPEKHVMFVANPCNYKEDRYARHLCHEMGHLNGWPGDHPNGEKFNPQTEQTSPQTHP